MNILLTILKLLPTILQAVISVEQIITAPKSGATKKDLVMSSISAVTKAGENADDKTVASISALVDGVVTTLNAGGVFSKAA